jgi:hypothetical protein
MRTDDGKYTSYELEIADLGGTAGKNPMPVGMILFTEYAPGRVRWRPKSLTPGRAVIELVQYALPMRRQPAFSLKVMNSLVRHAVVFSGRRGGADRFAKTLLRFADKQWVDQKLTLKREGA